MKLQKKWFTLIEMIVVVVLIWLIAAVLIMKILHVQERARDTKRKADVRVIWQWVQIYKADYKKYPEPFLTTTCVWSNNSDFSAHHLGTTLSAYVTSFPVDPSIRGLFGIQRTTNPLDTCIIDDDKNYHYSPVMKDGVLSGGFIVVAWIENIQSANFLMNYPIAYVAWNKPIFDIAREILRPSMVYAMASCEEQWLDDWHIARGNGCTNPPESVCTTLWDTDSESATAIWCLPLSTCADDWLSDWNMAYENGCTNPPESVCDDLWINNPESANTIWCPPLDPCIALFRADYQKAIKQWCTNPPADVCPTLWNNVPANALSLWCQNPTASVCQNIALTNPSGAAGIWCQAVSSSNTYLWPEQSLSNITSYMCEKWVNLIYGWALDMDRNTCTLTLPWKGNTTKVLQNITRYIFAQ
jgi:type II secretory pathway pseudopilin PulG